MLLLTAAVVSSLFLAASSQNTFGCLSWMTCPEGYACMYVRPPGNFYMRPACVLMDADCQDMGAYDLTDVGNVKRQVTGTLLQTRGECNNDRYCTFLYMGGGMIGGGFGGAGIGGGIVKDDPYKCCLTRNRYGISERRCVQKPYFLIRMFG